MYFTQQCPRAWYLNIQMLINILLKINHSNIQDEPQTIDMIYIIGHIVIFASSCRSHKTNEGVLWIQVAIWSKKAIQQLLSMSGVPFDNFSKTKC
jgi:uncharacterized protein (DUF983 family)